jgi:pimeloyl-ACP methyl ester carboxylesterase
MSDKNVIHLNGGQTIGYAEYGDSNGVPVIALHGMPNTRLMWKSCDAAATRHGLRLIAPDRAGYGLSNGHLPRSLLDYPDEVSAFADALGLGEFVILGASGGSPAAYACAERLSHRLSRAVIVSGIAPLTLPNSLAGMASMNRLVFRLGRISPFLTSLLLTQMLKSSLPAMRKYVANNSSGSPDMEPELYAVLTEDLTEVTRTSRKGIAFDLKVLWHDWGFHFEAIRTKVSVWHCEADDLAPVRLAHAIADRIPDCETHFLPGGSHLAPVTQYIDQIFDSIAIRIASPVG